MPATTESTVHIHKIRIVTMILVNLWELSLDDVANFLSPVRLHLIDVDDCLPILILANIKASVCNVVIVFISPVT